MFQPARVAGAAHGNQGLDGILVADILMRRVKNWVDRSRDAGRRLAVGDVRRTVNWSSRGCGM